MRPHGPHVKITTPNYAREVIQPLAKALGEALPEHRFTLQDSVEVFDQNAYFLLRLEEILIGGFSYPGPKTTQINITIFTHGKPWGRSIVLTKFSQLVRLLSELAEFLKPDKTEHNDE